jgi:hypothetical protein
VNSNICYKYNFEEVLDFGDSGGMLEWLQGELGDLEDQGGSAIIIGHLPNIDECMR